MTDKDAKPRRRSGRPSTPIVSKRAAIEAALQIIDDEGLDGLSVRALGRALDITGASLYHHFADKDEILREVVRLMLSKVRLPDEIEPTSWQSATIASAMAYRQAVMNHPNAAPLLISRPWRGFAHDIVNHSLEVLDEAGVPTHLHMTILRASEMLSFASVVFGEFADNAGFGEVDEKYEALRSAIAADTMDSDEAFATTLRALITGFSMSVTMEELGRST